MADPEHVALIKKGPHAVARWREELYWRRRQLDLSGAFLTRARLSGADLDSDNLSGIDLTDADVGLADLSLANLKETDQACLTFKELSERYPDAPPSIKQRAAFESQRAGCG